MHVMLAVDPTIEPCQATPAQALAHLLTPNTLITLKPCPPVLIIPPNTMPIPIAPRYLLHHAVQIHR